jgi:hypothetical protein
MIFNELTSVYFHVSEILSPHLTDDILFTIPKYFLFFFTNERKITISYYLKQEHQEQGFLFIFTNETSFSLLFSSYVYAIVIRLDQGLTRINLEK